MRTSKFHLLAIVFLMGLSVVGCKKSDSTDNSLKDQNTVAATQDAESQDAQADNVDQSVDNITDALEANNFSAVKSAQVGAPTYKIVSNGGLAADDTSKAAFPKTITLTFATDTTINGEKFKQTGTITIIVVRTKTTGSWKDCLKRTITLDAFKTENDSSSFTVTGTRTMTRKEITFSPVLTPNTYLAATNLKVAVLDSIKSNFTFTIICGTYTGSFTRVVNRTRQALAHFEKLSGGLIWHQAYLKDTLIYKGSVTGVSTMGLDSTYSRVISDSDPIVFTRCGLLVPVISSGTLTLTRETPKGTKEATITYSKDGCRTVVTIEMNGKTKEIERKLNRIYKRWW